MVTLAKKLEELRTAKGISRVQLSSELGFAKYTIEKFETGRLTPSRQQMEKLAAYFGVSVGTLNGTGDGEMTDWMLDEPADSTSPAYHPVKAAPKKQKAGDAQEGGSSIFAPLLKTEAFRQAVLDVLRTPEGQELIRKAMKK